MKTTLGHLRRADEDFRLIEPGDHVAVGVSGGKDSLLLLCALATYRRFQHKDFRLTALTVSMGLEPFDLTEVRALCQRLDVPFIVEETQIGEIVFSHRQEKNPCALCAKMRRGALNDAIKAHGRVGGGQAIGPQSIDPGEIPLAALGDADGTRRLGRRFGHRLRRHFRRGHTLCLGGALHRFRDKGRRVGVVGRDRGRRGGVEDSGAVSTGAQAQDHAKRPQPTVSDGAAADHGVSPSSGSGSPGPQMSRSPIAEQLRSAANSSLSMLMKASTARGSNCLPQQRSISARATSNSRALR